MEEETTKIWIELLKLGIFAIFVTSMLEVIKNISAKGFWGIITDLWGTLILNRPMCKESIQTFNFMIALLCCYAFDYGVVGNLIEPGKAARADLSGWIDYIGTASLVYAGADTLFKKFASMRNSWDTAKKTTSTQSMSQTDTTTITQTDTNPLQGKKGDT